MIEEKVTNNPSTKQFDVERIYVKKSNLELYNAPAAFLIEGKPDVNFEIKNSYAKLEQDYLYEVTLQIHMKIKVVDKEKNIDQEVCVCHVEQCGVFKLNGFVEDETKRLLLGYGPDILYPYARHAIAELLTSGSIPPVLLKPISFEVLYQQQFAEQKDNLMDTKNVVIH